MLHSRMRLWASGRALVPHLPTNPMTDQKLIVAEFHDYTIEGALLEFEVHVSPTESRTEYEVQLSTAIGGVNPLLSIREFEIPQVVRILSKALEAIDKREQQAELEASVR